VPARLAIWEAKREGIYFELPAGLQKRVYKLTTIFKDNKLIEDAVKQCIGYCQDRSTAVGVVCNGHQLIAFLGSRQDSIPALDGSCLVFTSFPDMEESFRDLWQSLSKPGVQARNIHAHLRESASLPPPEKLSGRLFNYPGFKDRNPFQLELQIMGTCSYRTYQLRKR